MLENARYRLVGFRAVGATILALVAAASPVRGQASETCPDMGVVLTPAEVRALRVLGADAVSMSTVLEAAHAHYLGLKVLAVALVANRAGDENGTSHEMVLRTITETLPRAAEFLGAAFGEMTW